MLVISFSCPNPQTEKEVVYCFSRTPLAGDKGCFFQSDTGFEIWKRKGSNIYPLFCEFIDSRPRSFQVRESHFHLYTGIFGVSTYYNDGALIEGGKERDLNSSYFLRGKLTRGDILLWKGGTLLWGIAAGVSQTGCRQLKTVAKMVPKGLLL